jgi:hypothetical protein
MTSAINPNNIDGTYPVAGQDNNSQGFRDNFTNTKTNFQFAANEITELQSKAVLKAALTGTTLNNNMGGAVLSNGVLQDFGVTRVALGSLSGSVVIDYEAGSFQTVTTSGSITLSFTNFPPVGVAASVTVQISVSNTAHTVTLTGVTQGLVGIQGRDGQVITFAQTGTYSFEFSTNGDGSTIAVQDLSRPLSEYTNPVFLSTPDIFVGNAGNVSLTSSTTVFTQAGNVTGNLAAGSSGQVKILAYGNAAVGNTVITVANAAWGGSSTASFGAVGSACTLQYIDSRWFCIGNNGCTFV